MLVEFSIIPVGAGESMGDAIASVIKTVDESGVPYKANAMSTVIECEWDRCMGLIKKCEDEVLKLSPRAVTSIHIDHRPKKPADRIDEKMKSVEKRLGRKVKS